MSFKLRAAVVAAVVLVVAVPGAPVTAGAALIADPSGVDYDAACWIDVPKPPPPPNSVGSPGTSDCQTTGVSTYNNSTESTDLRSVSLSTNGVNNAGPSDTQLVATFEIDGAIPPAGGVCNPHVGGAGCPDLPDNGFIGAGYKALFQVPAHQNNSATNAAGGGCPRIPSGSVFDQHAHWGDGFHFFVGFTFTWDGTRWVHSAQIGEYDPSPDGGFPFTELGTNDGGGWDGGDPHMAFGANWNVVVSGSTVTVTVDGVVLSGDISNCATGVFSRVYAKAGDEIINVKGLSTADVLLASPVTVPSGILPGGSNVTTTGGYLFFSDTTSGFSTNSGLVGGSLQSNTTDIAFTPGAIERNRGAGSVMQEQEEPARTTDGGGGSQPGPRPSDPVDTLGESPACPTPTFGGTLPSNPWRNPSVPCHYDDDNIPMPNLSNPQGPWTAINPGERGTLLAEFWDTAFNFTAV